MKFQHTKKTLTCLDCVFVPTAAEPILHLPSVHGAAMDDPKVLYFLRVHRPHESAQHHLQRL